MYHFGKQWKRSGGCGELSAGDEGKRVTLAGWVKKVREFGDLTFVDLWDRSGLVQLTAEVGKPGMHRIFRSLKSEDVVAVTGKVTKRPADMINSRMATGEIEVEVDDAEIFSRSKVPPFNVTDKGKVNDDLRLRYRYLDLRRDSMQANLRLRHDLSICVRNFLSGENFLEIETPMLVRRTPEGARDYLVPSRLQPGKFYALPQSPQLYKQILMVSGCDRYFQLARCLRDEDLRADRQPEHTQIDIEMSFISEDDIFDIAERLMKRIFSEVMGIELQIPFPRMEYDEVMSRYGSDKPDLRFGLEIIDCTDIFRDSGFGAFASEIETGGVARGISFEKGASFSNSQIKKLEKTVKGYGAKGLAWLKIEEGAISSPVEKYISDTEKKELIDLFGIPAKGSSLLLLVAGAKNTVEKAVGQLRVDLGTAYLTEGNREFNFLWVNRFPLFVRSDGGSWEPAHHIFSMPLEDDIGLLEKDPGGIRGHLYDLVCNGVELGSGSIRIHDRELQERLFSVIGIGREESERKFGFLLEAFEYGAPPHGGIAVGVDRLSMILCGESSIRDFIAFPKTQSATSLMEGAPSEVEDELLRELHIEVIKGNDREE
ncbi:MAG: aspartate--tRNA ligase [Candidatus Krumholzibacteriota bacterium]|nr:aspartate--tRNA ligase [Candidatus Krumholzibacteriota bacterium]